MSNPPLYPLKFQPIYKEKIWGGQKIRKFLKKDFGNIQNCGESWEISGVQGDLSQVDNGPLVGATLPQLIDTYKEELVGRAVYNQFGNEFPLLIKFIDANDDLSIQVHPDDEIARKRHGSFGKSEMWYIIEHDEDATLYTGFAKEISKEEFARCTKQGTVLSVLNQERVSDGDVFYLPAGRVHSIGKGILLAEIQQTSDVTYRVYDFDRTDELGNRRELHITEALDVMDYSLRDDYRTNYRPIKNQGVPVVTCPYFTTNFLDFERPFPVQLDMTKSFKIFVCVGGASNIHHHGTVTSLVMGESVLLPAQLEEVSIEPIKEVQLLESYIT